MSWFVAASWSNRTTKRAGLAAEWLYRLVTLAGAALLFVFNVHRPYVVLWHIDARGQWMLVGIVVAGFLFCWWARIHLGRLWSSSVTKKADHHVVDTGPYGIVRHPIYTGLIVAAVATAVAQGRPAALLGAALMATGFFLKARLEERFLRQELGAEAYDAYRRHVPMLVPFWPV